MRNYKNMNKILKALPCPICGSKKVIIERWSSGGPMYMVKCNEPDCSPDPPAIYPTGRDLNKVIEEWNGLKRKGGAE